MQGFKRINRCGAERDRTADLLNAIVGLPTHIVGLTGFPCHNRVTTFTFELICFFMWSDSAHQSVLVLTDSKI